MGPDHLVCHDKAEYCREKDGDEKTFLDDHESFDLIRVLLEVCIDDHEASLIIFVITIVLLNLFYINHTQHGHRGKDRQQPDVFERVDPILEPAEKAIVEGPQPDEQLHCLSFRVCLTF